MEEILLYPLLKVLVLHCNTICETQCCGLDAYDFSPFQLATFLISDDGRTVSERVRQRLDIALSNFLLNYGPNGATAQGGYFETIKYLTPEDSQSWVETVRLSKSRAIELIKAEYGN